MLDHVGLKVSDLAKSVLFYLRTDYGSDYHAAFLLDPDGNNVEAVCIN